MVRVIERLAQLDAERSSVLLHALREHEETVSALATRVAQLEGSHRAAAEETAALRAELRRMREELISSSKDVGSNESTPCIIIRSASRLTGMPEAEDSEELVIELSHRKAWQALFDSPPSILEDDLSGVARRFAVQLSRLLSEFTNSSASQLGSASQPFASEPVATTSPPPPPRRSRAMSPLPVAAAPVAEAPAGAAPVAEAPVAAAPIAVAVEATVLVAALVNAESNVQDREQSPIVLVNVDEDEESVDEDEERDFDPWDETKPANLSWDETKPANLPLIRDETKPANLSAPPPPPRHLRGGLSTAEPEKDAASPEDAIEPLDAPTSPSSRNIGKEIGQAMSLVFVEAPMALFKSSAELIDGISGASQPATLDKLIERRAALAKAKEAGLSCGAAWAAGYSCADAKAVGYDLMDAKAAGWTTEELLNAGYINQALAMRLDAANKQEPAGQPAANLKEAKKGDKKKAHKKSPKP